MPRFLITVLLLGAAAAAFFVGIMPQWAAIKGVRGEIDRLQNVHKELKELGSKAENLRAKYNSIDEADLQKLRAVAPAKPGTSALLASFEDLAESNQLALQSVDFLAVRAAGGGKTASGSGLYQDIPLNINLTGSYESFVRFLEAFEHNVRLVDVNEITFGSNTGRGVADPRQISISLRGKVYYRP